MNFAKQTIEELEKENTKMYEEEKQGLYDFLKKNGAPKGVVKVLDDIFAREEVDSLCLGFFSAGVKRGLQMVKEQMEETLKIKP
jgi:hypothetical protein